MSESVNPNVETTPSDGATLSKAPGESVNFDQMEAIMDQGERAPQVERQSTNEGSGSRTDIPEGTEEATEKRTGPSKEDQVQEPETEIGEIAEQETREASKESPSEEQEVEENVDADEKPAKIYKVKQGESELDLHADTEFEVTVKGEPEKVSLQDMMNNYSGKQSWDRKFSDLDKERKTFESEREVLHETVNDLHDSLVGDNAIEDFVITAAEAFNVPPFELLDKLEQKWLESRKDSEGFELSEDDRQLKQQAKKAEYYKNRYQKDRDKVSRRTEQTKAREQLDGAAEKYGLVDEFGKVDNDLIAESFESLVKGGFEKSTITADMIGQYYFAKQRSLKISDVLKDVAPELDGEEFSDAIGMLTSELSDIELSDDKVSELVRAVYGQSNTKAISEKVRKGSNVNPESKTKPVSPANDPLFFDDI